MLKSLEQKLSKLPASCFLRHVASFLTNRAQEGPLFFKNDPVDLSLYAWFERLQILRLPRHVVVIALFYLEYITKGSAQYTILTSTMHRLFLIACVVASDLFGHFRTREEWICLTMCFSAQQIGVMQAEMLGLLGPDPSDLCFDCFAGDACFSDLMDRVTMEMLHSS